MIIYIIQIFLICVVGLAAVLSAAMVIWAVVNVSRRVEAGAVLILLTFLLDILFVVQPYLPIGLNIYISDVVFVGLLVITLVRSIFVRVNLVVERQAWWLFGLLWISLFVTGAYFFKTTAGVEFRQYFYFFSASIYITTFRVNRDDVEKILDRVVLAAGALCLLAVLRWLDQMLGTGTQWGMLVGANKWRVLPASATFFLLFALLSIATYHPIEGVKKSWRANKIMLVVLALGILMLQHRTIWMCALVAFVYMSWLKPSLRKYLLSPLPIFSIVSVIAITAASAALGLLGEVGKAISDSVAEMFQSEGSTFTWRLQSWTELLRDWLTADPVTLLVGHPFGNGWKRYVADLGHETNYSPHNFYVQVALRGGLVGLVLLGFIYWKLVRGSIAAFRAAQDERAALLALFVGVSLIIQLVYAIPYWPSYAHGLFLGLAIALVSKSRMSYVKNKPFVVV